MEGRTDVAGCWRLTATVGELTANDVTGHVDVARPERGLNKLRVSGRELTGRMLCVEREMDADETPTWPLAVKESYTRAVDLVASYSEASDWPYSPQIYWSFGALDSIDGVVGSLALLVSVQTHLLDTWPRIAASSRLACDETFRVRSSGAGDARTEAITSDGRIAASSETCCIVRRLAGASLSYAEIMLGSDFRDVTCTRDAATGECSLKWTLFSEFMEKGVIRRARLVSAFLPRENDVELAATCCEAVERSPLPLTA